MLSLVHTYTDQAFILLCQESEILRLEAKVTCLLQHCADGEGLLKPVQRSVDGKTYAFGFCVQREEQAQWIAHVLHGILNVQKLEDSSKAIAARLVQCITKHEQLVLLEQEIEQHRAFVEGVKDTYLYKGYNFAQLRQLDKLYSWQAVSFSQCFSDESLFYSIVSSCSDGHVVYQMEVYLAELLEEVRSGIALPCVSLKVDELQTQTGLQNPVQFVVLNRVTDMEQTLTKLLPGWKERNNRTQYAAFAEFLYDKGYFECKKNRIKTCKEFILHRYGVNVGSTLASYHKKEREQHKKKIKLLLQYM